MDPVTHYAIVNLAGFVAGMVLYAMLLAMALRGQVARAEGDAVNLLPLATAGLGLVWNAGELSLLAGLGSRSVAVAAFVALGFLPAVVVHAALRPAESSPSAPAVRLAAYGLSSAAAVLHVAGRQHPPSSGALLLLSAGFLVLCPAILAVTPPPARGRRAVTWVVALTLFSISAWHLAGHPAREETWSSAVFGHHAALPLAVAILFQDYRFALADLFLKRALALLMLSAIVAVSWAAAWPLLGRAPGPDAPAALALVFAAWVATALAYPALERLASRVVDRLVLRRADYDALRGRLAAQLAAADSETAALDEISATLGAALSSRGVTWSGGVRSPQPGLFAAELPVTTTEPPAYTLHVGELREGRRLLSADRAFLEQQALALGRRIDGLRLVHERCARDLREGEIARLVAQAELRALRAQLNPHFLFNALTTLGYLMRVAPDRAQRTLVGLTHLLRGVLRRSNGDVVTLGQELDLVESYLAIERARFEERLETAIDVPRALRGALVPPLVLQPLVENAIKHGISPSRRGGRVEVSATTGGDPPQLLLEVRDSGVGASAAQLAAGRGEGVGLANIERRLAVACGDGARLEFHTAPGLGARVALSLPLREAAVPSTATAGARR